MEAYCPKCQKPVPVRTSNRVGTVQVRYHKCSCGWEKKTTISAEKVWRRGR